MDIGVISYLLRHHDTPSAMAFLRDIGFENVELDYRHADGLCDYHIYHVHFKDSDQHQPLGSGTADLPAVLAELQGQGYNRLLSIEHYEYGGIEDDVLRAGLTQALEYVKELSTT